MQEREIIGGATFMDAPAGLTVSRPLAVLRIDPSGLSVDIRSRFMRLFQRAISRLIVGRAWPDGPGWACTWEDLSEVRLAHRSVILTGSNGVRCRFQAGRRAAMQPLEEAISQHGVAVERVRSTLPYLVTKRR